ncbi:12672_t:CDS:2 [Funneliformis geosporum]|uniref:6948_t:CDS:1 n=1 Tax=Funneliformis geosporum TaxID=1117311 RepID=A0A9W4SZX7_9GLOM|nr:6948_t:CDS:2 [Funneliformis geosporum]CAI2187170.1 12672_t:CDS:2 [Funneliformis geosporum]
MGAQSSKQVSRKLPQNVVSNVKSSAIETHSCKQVLNEPITSDKGDEKDPRLLNNLFTIGHVNVPKEKITFTQILRNRKAFDEENGGNIPKNRILVYELREMLEQRKKAPNEFTAERLSAQYNLDVPTIETLLQHINTFTLTGGVNSRAVWVEDSQLFRKNENVASD